MSNAGNKFAVLKIGNAGAKTQFLAVDSNIYDKIEAARPVLQERRRNRDLAKTHHRYAIITFEMPTDEEFA